MIFRSMAMRMDKPNSDTSSPHEEASESNEEADFSLHRLESPKLSRSFSDLSIANEKPIARIDHKKKF